MPFDNSPHILWCRFKSLKAIDQLVSLLSNQPEEVCKGYRFHTYVDYYITDNVLVNSANPATSRYTKLFGSLTLN